MSIRQTLGQVFSAKSKLAHWWTEVFQELCKIGEARISSCMVNRSNYAAKLGWPVKHSKCMYLAGQHQEYVRQLEVRVGRTLEVKNSCWYAQCCII